MSVSVCQCVCVCVCMSYRFVNSNISIPCGHWTRAKIYQIVILDHGTLGVKWSGVVRASVAEAIELNVKG